ncbi:hypothetical protein G6O67_004353 [Ophiocordyceps sinensis]|uniref:Uncharacterized protein n=1 Tax=Ophiocordyceps sinensis TaxID=72228 RepID=A0A8H4LYL9_9HYPO|nr:hypothetical protein G6O67_004353 [Ophiocordyceps sinensis]
MMLPSAPYRLLALGCLAAFALGGPTAAPSDAVGSGKPGPNPLYKLAVTLRQSSSSPPTVVVTVTNRNKFPVTMVSYQSPLDGLALALGQLSMTPAGSKKPLELRRVAVKRVWPPPEDALVVVQPGASVTNHLVMEEPTVPMDKLGKRATVVLGGEWMAVWPRPRSQVSKSDIENASESAFQGPFSTRPLEIEVE